MKFKKHLQTKDYTFYCDFTESDENNCVKMYNTDNVLISDNYFATEYLFEILTGETDEEIIFISDEMEYNRKEILKQL